MNLAYIWALYIGWVPLPTQGPCWALILWQTASFKMARVCPKSNKLKNLTECAFQKTNLPV